jgi:beta-galactosidase
MRRYLTVVSCLGYMVILAFPFKLTAQVRPKASRFHLSMDRDWKFFLGDNKNASASDFNDVGWRQLDLPHDWSIEGTVNMDEPTGRGGGYLPAGIGWYRKTFQLPAWVTSKQVNIQFDGIYKNSEVWINGHYLGKRPNGYISFCYDLTPYLVNGRNTIAVRVDNSEQPNSRWYSGSGIYRHVWMDITNAIHIAQWGTTIATPEADSARALVNVTTKIDNRGAAAAAILTSVIYDRNGRKVASETMPVSIGRDTSAVFSQQIKLTSPDLWSTSAQPLYTVNSVIASGKKIIDDYQTTFGVRQLEYSNTRGFLLNGKRVKINGVCLHHDGGCVGAAVPIKIWVTRLKLLKQMGCNAIRTSHNPVAPEFLDLCDKMGFLVMDETFDVWKIGKVKFDYHLNFDSSWRKDLTAEIRRDRNHPSVILWSAGNEIGDQGSDRGVALLKEMLDVFHAEDSTRPVTTGNDQIAADGGSTKLAFLNAEDIVGYNYVDRWHERRELYYSIDHFDHPGWKMIGTESEALRNTPEDSLTIEYGRVTPNYNRGMVRAEQLWKFVALHDYVIGDFMWTGIDYLGEAHGHTKGSIAGEIDMTNRPKDGFYFYQSQWTNLPVLHLIPHWNWKGHEGQIMPVLAYTNCDTVELFVNNKSYGIKVQEFPRQGTSGGWNTYERPLINGSTADLHLTWDVAYEPGTIKAVGRKHGREVLVEELHTTGKPAALRITGDSTTVYPDGSDVALFDIDVVDSGGNLVPDANDLIRFNVTGNGKLLAVDNGNQGDLNSFKLPERRAFKGHAYAVVQASRNPGNLQLNVEARGLKPASISLITRKSPGETMAIEDLK